MFKIREKKHRLPKEFYKGEKIVTFTMCIKGAERIFITKELFWEFERMLCESILQYQCEGVLYLFMPDHLHLILGGKTSDSRVIEAADMFKQKSGFWFSKNMGYSRWQKDYHDHIIRNNEDLSNHISYILNNPVRAGIAGYWKDYEFKGSTKFDLDNWE